MSVRSLDPVMRAPITMSPGGKVAPGAGSRLLMTGYCPGDATGLAAISGPGDETGVPNESGVGVGWNAAATANVAGAPPSIRTGVPPTIGAAPSRGRSGARLVQPTSSITHAASAN